MLNFLLNVIKGIFIGLACVIPGLSGATIALLLLVYEKLITELAKINYSLIKKIIRLDFKGLNNQLSFSFLIPISIGGIMGIFLFAKLLDNFDLLGKYKPMTLSYFFGLVLGSTLYIMNMISEKKNIHYILFFVGLIFAISIGFMPSFEDGNNNLLYIFFCGFIGVFGMIIPGLSGSHLLLILGSYTLIVKSINNFLYNIEYSLYLLVFFIGIAFGVISLSKIIKWIFQRYRNETLAIMSGFVLGSLIFIWPIKKENDQVSIIENLLYPTLNNQSIQYLILMILGLLTVTFLNIFNKKNV